LGRGVVGVDVAGGAGRVRQTGDPAYDKAFNAAFDKSTHDSCVPSAVAHGASPEAAESYCTCVVKELDNLPVARKQALNGSSPELSNAAADCRP